MNGGNYYAALGMSVAENTGTRELEAASQGLSSALSAQVENQKILTQANQDLYSVFNNTNALVKDIQTDEIDKQKREEYKKSKQIMLDDAIDKSNEATMNILTGYENYLKEGANSTLKDEITQSITGNKDINVTTKAIDNVIDNLNLENANYIDPVTKSSRQIGKDALKGFDKEAIRRYILNPDRLFSDFKNGLVTQEQYGAIAYLSNNGGFANAVRKEDEAKRALKDINDGIKTPAMYQREAQILKETNPFFYRGISENDLAMELSQSQDIMTGRFNGKTYQPYEEFDKLRRLAEYDKSNIGQTVVKNDNKDMDKYATKEDIVQMMQQLAYGRQGSSLQSKTLDKALNADKKDDNPIKIDINTGEILPEYKQDAVRQQQEINKQVNQTKNIANNMNSSEKYNIENKEAKKLLDEGRITQGEYEQMIYSYDKGKIDSINALADSSNTSKAYDNVMKSKIMKDIQEYVSFNNKGYKDIFMTDDGNISKKHQALLDSIDIDELRNTGRQLIGIKQILEQEVEQETNPNKKIALQNRLKEVNDNLELVNSIGKTKAKMNTFDNDFNHTVVTTNDAKRQLKNAEQKYNEAINTEKQWADTKAKVSSAELDKNNNDKISAVNSAKRINTLALSSQLGTPAKAVKEDGSIDEKYKPYLELGEQRYKIVTDNDIKNIDGTVKEINTTNNSRLMISGKSVLAILLDPDSYNSLLKDVESGDNKTITKIWQDMQHNAHQFEIGVGTGKGLENAAYIDPKTAQDYINSFQSGLIKLLKIYNNNSEKRNIILKTKSKHTLSSEMKNVDDEQTVRDIIEFFARQGTKIENGRLVLDDSKKNMTPLEFNEYTHKGLNEIKRSSHFGEKILNFLLSVGQ